MRCGVYTQVYWLQRYTNVFTDLTAHWQAFTSQTPVDLAHFVPFEYKFALQFSDYKLICNVNEYNVIDPQKINDPDVNTHITFKVSYCCGKAKAFGMLMNCVQNQIQGFIATVGVGMSMTNYGATAGEVTYNVDVSTLTQTAFNIII